MNGTGGQGVAVTRVLPRPHCDRSGCLWLLWWRPVPNCRGAPCPRVVTAPAAVQPSRPPPAVVTTNHRPATAWTAPRNGGARTGRCARSKARRASGTGAPDATRRSRAGCRMSWPGPAQETSRTAATGTGRAGTRVTAEERGSSARATRRATDRQRLVPGGRPRPAARPRPAVRRLPGARRGACGRLSATPGSAVTGRRKGTGAGPKGCVCARGGGAAERTGVRAPPRHTSRRLSST